MRGSEREVEEERTVVGVGCMILDQSGGTISK